MSNNNTVFIILGSNINPSQNFHKGLSLIHQQFNVLDQSPIIKTTAIGPNINHKLFYNAAVKIKTNQTASQLKYQYLRPIEKQLNRIRTSNPNSDRTFDADVVLYNNDFQPDNDPPIPDPNLFNYPFISYLLSLMSPSYIIPNDGRTMKQLSEICTNRPSIMNIYQHLIQIINRQ